MRTARVSLLRFAWTMRTGIQRHMRAEHASAISPCLVRLSDHGVGIVRGVRSSRRGAPFISR